MQRQGHDCVPARAGWRIESFGFQVPNLSPTSNLKLETFVGRASEVMKCPYCERPVRLSVFDRDRLLRLILPRCHACHRYVVTWLHALIFGALAAAGIVLLLEVL